jgi:hypothetical protein
MTKFLIVTAALTATSLGGCGTPLHQIRVEPSGAYASEVLPSAHRALSQATQLALPTDVSCQIDAVVDAREHGRAGASLNGVAASWLQVEVALEANCDGTRWTSHVTHEVLAGATESDRRSALADSIGFACREASAQLRSDD